MLILKIANFICIITLDYSYKLLTLLTLYHSYCIHKLRKLLCLFNLSHYIKEKEKQINIRKSFVILADIC